jgi:hypothetical protein
MQVNPRTSAALWVPDNSSLLALLPHRYPQLATQCQELATTHLSEPQVQALLFCWHQEAPGSPQSMETPALPTVPDSKRAPTPPSKIEKAIFPTEGRKAITCYFAGCTKALFPQEHRSPVLHAALPCRRVTSLLSKSWDSSSSTEWPSATLLVLEGQPLTAHRDPALHCNCRRVPVPHQSAGTLAP